MTRKPPPHGSTTTQRIASGLGLVEDTVVAQQVAGDGVVNGLMAGRSAFAMGAARVLGADLVAERRVFAATLGVEPVEGEDARTAIRDMTGGRGPDAVVEAVGSDATIELSLNRQTIEDAARRHGYASTLG